MPSGVNQSPVRAYLGMLRRRLGVVVAVVVVFTGLTLAYTLRQAPVYEASSRVLLQGTLAEQLVAGVEANTAFLIANRGETEIQVMQSPAIVDAVSRELGHRPDVSVARVGESTIVLITARSGDRLGAAQDATTFAHVYVEVRKQQQLDQLLKATEQFQAKVTELNDQLATVEAPLRAIDDQIAATRNAGDLARLQAQQQALEDQLSSDINSITDRRAVYVGQVDRLQLATSTTVTGGAQVVADATAPSSPIAPDPVRSTAVALGLSLIIGIGLAFVFEQLDDRIRSTAQLEQLTGLTALGLIPSVPSWRKGKEHEVVAVDSDNSAAAEAYRSLRTSVQFIGIDQVAHVIQITSPLPSEGKTTTTANLGVALARAGKRVILVDSDLRRSRLNELFELPGEYGLMTVLLREMTLQEALLPVPGEPRLALLASGQVPPNPAELLSVGGYADLIANVRAEADYVIMDTPPVLPVADARIISAFVDVTLLVVAANASAQHDIARSLELLAQVEARVVGTVLNDIPRRGRYSHSYDYWYSYGPAPKVRGRTKGHAEPKVSRPRVDVADLDRKVTTSD